MTNAGTTRCYQSIGRVTANAAVSAGLLRLDLELDRDIAFAPGQFAMLNLTGPDALIFSRPFSILASEGPTVSFLYRVVGRGTALLAACEPGAAVTFLGPLGNGFPAPPEQPVVLVAGGVGLPPLYAWWQRYRRDQDAAYFGGRDGGDVPWSLVEDGWRISVDRRRDLPAGCTAFEGVVTDLCRRELVAADGPRLVLACGPVPLLAAAQRWSQEFDWSCLVSLEERMGCGYGVCKGCVVPLRPAAGARGTSPDHATCCEEGPVFAAERVDWENFGGIA